jgi:hypothetical protein
VAKLRENSDLLAILILIAVLGIGHMPGISSPFRDIRRELHGPGFRMPGVARLVHAVELVR